ncbi:outer membrane beta-barrel protein [Sphingobacterium sp. N143]|uniref:TonB-dependent receptor n=1 Tax=Sphingobacterium sp. N143 TaxID=2746727 RepID=UPI00257920B6|nr:TonB-dependent receptor [Sphingobacterium sp. N143]MDM1293820.1 outer membrane beta-barrel protein [Sphingobacterium sp. N143]
MNANIWVTVVVFFYLLLLGTSVFAQQHIAGKLLDNSTSKPISGASVTIISRKDSSKFQLPTDIVGRFSSGSLPNGAYMILVQPMGYSADSSQVILTGEPVDVLFKLNNSEIVLDEINITPSTVQVKGDTLEFDTKKYVTQDFADADELVKQIPGVEIDEDGNVKAQGEAVNKIIIDGREFFSTDPKVALRNLPADVIAKVQIIDDKTEQAKFSGFDDGTRMKVINIVTKPEKRKSYFGKISGGVGPEEKYAINTQVTKMNPKRQYSIDINTNNVNQPNGFSPRGNNRGRTGQGITTRFNAGFNYLDRFFGERMDFNTNYAYHYTDNNIISQNKTDYTAGNRANQLTNQEQLGNTYTNNHALSIRANWKIDSLQKLDFQPRFSYQSDNRHNSSMGNTLLNLTEILNSSQRDNKSLGENFNWGGDLTYMRRLGKPGRTISLNLNGSFSTNKSNAANYALNSYYRDGAFDRVDTVDNRNYSKGDNNGFRSKVAYTEMLGKYSRIQGNYTFRNTARYSDRKTYEFLAETGQVGELKDRLSNEFRNDFLYHSAGLSYLFNKKDSIRFQIGLDYQNAAQANDRILPSILATKSHFNSLLPNVNFQYNFTKETRIELRYNAKTNTPSIEQLQDFIDNQNPLRISSGNPNLKQEYDHNLVMQFRSINKASGRSFTSGFTADFIQHKISNTIFTTDSAFTIAEDIVLGPGGQYSKPENFDGVYNLRWHNSFGYRIEPLKLNINLNNNLYFNQNYTLLNFEKVDAKTYGINQRIGVNTAFSKELIIGLDYNGNLSYSKNSATETSNYSVYRHTVGNSIALTLLKTWTLNSTFNYLYNGSILNAASTTSLLWNIAIGKKLFRRRNAEVNLTVFDLLNDNKNINQQINDLWVRVSQSNAITRYAMLSFTYHIRGLRGKGGKH